MATVIRRRTRRRGIKKEFPLQLTSMMDVLMIIVVFLLKSYGLSSMGVTQADKLELPTSSAPETYGEGLVVIISRDKIVVDNKPVLEFVGDPEQRKFELPNDKVGTETSIAPVFDALKAHKDNFELLASRSPNPEEALKKWTGDVFVQADKAVPYELLRKVMYTAGLVGYKRFRLTVQKIQE